MNEKPVIETQLRSSFCQDQHAKVGSKNIKAKLKSKLTGGKGKTIALRLKKILDKWKA